MNKIRFKARFLQSLAERRWLGFTCRTSSLHTHIITTAMASKDDSLYGLNRPRNLNKGKEISSASTLSFTSQLSSLINSSTARDSPKPTAGRARPKKEDIFSTHNRNTAKRAKRDLAPDHAGAFEQKHTTKGEALDPRIWERSKRKMEEKARIYAALKRGDIEDIDERYAVDFDQKWADARAAGKEDVSDDDDQEDDVEAAPGEQVEYVDAYGRTRTGTRLDAERARHAISLAQGNDDATGRPAAPSNVIYGDTIQHQAFDLDEPRAAQMADLASKRDKALTPPPEEHFDSSKEIRTKGTAFFQFSHDAEERKRQMEGLEQERAETERVRTEREKKLEARKKQIEERRVQIQQRNAKRKADEFLQELDTGVYGQMEKSEVTDREEKEQVQQNTATDMTDRIATAIEREEDDT